MGTFLFILMLVSPWVFGPYGTIICAALWIGYLIVASSDITIVEYEPMERGSDRRFISRGKK